MKFDISLPFLWLLNSASANSLTPRQSAAFTIVEKSYKTTGSLVVNLRNELKSWPTCQTPLDSFISLTKAIEIQQNIAGILHDATTRVKASGSIMLQDSGRDDDWIPDFTITLIGAMNGWVAGKGVVGMTGQGQAVLSSLLDLQRAKNDFRYAVQAKLPLTFQMAWNQDRTTQIASIDAMIKEFTLL